MTAERKFTRLQISLRTFLLVVNLTVLALPLAGVQLLRLYESALVRQTESTLIAQAAFVSAFYRSFVVEFGTQDWMNISRPIIGEINNNADGWIPRPPELDLSTSPLLPPYPDSLSSKVANAYALKIGNKLSPVLKDAQLTTLAAIRVVDPWGVVVASTANDTGEDISHGIEIQQALLGKPSSQIRQKTDLIDAKVSDPFSRSSQVRVFVASPILLHNRVVGAVMLSRTPPNIFQALYAKRWLLLQALTLMVVLVIVLTLLSYRLVTRPIRRLATQAEDVSRGRARGLQSLQRHNLPRTKELANLQSAITDMARSLADRSTYLTNFSRHVSHEFKTPIASIRAGVELFADHHQTMSKEEVSHFVSNITADTFRLQRLTERLNELTKAEMAQVEPHPHNLHSVLEKTVDDLGFAQHCVIDQRCKQFAIEIDPLGFAGSVEILLENALTHGATKIELEIFQETPLTLAIKDNGRGISSANVEQIFEPFFTTTRNQGGSGLGLSIAQALLKQNHCTLALQSASSPTTFTLTFDHHA